jgi:hypothetical protein
VQCIAHAAALLFGAWLVLPMVTLRGVQDFVSGDEVESLSPEEMVQLFDDFCSHR